MINGISNFFNSFVTPKPQDFYEKGTLGLMSRLANSGTICRGRGSTHHGRMGMEKGDN